MLIIICFFANCILQYALLKVAEWYPLHMSMHKLHLHDGLSQLLLQVTPSFHEAFTKKYSGMHIAIRKKALVLSLLITIAEHRCKAIGCGEVFVLDGNMKNSHEVCFATRAGYAEFNGLPGKVSTGCPNTPA